MDFNNGSQVSQISTFLMSPTRTFNNGDTISFLTRTGQNSTTFVDRLRLLLSLSGTSTNPAVFTTILLSVNEGLTTTGYPGTWTLYSATITGLAGPTSGRFAFNYNVPDSGPGGTLGDRVGIDVVTYALAVPQEIAVEQPALTNIPDAGTKDFGSVALGSDTSLQFTIKNTGGSNLTGLTITKDGTNSSEFTVTPPPAASVIPGGSTTFTVRFAPLAVGSRIAAIHIANNDLNENPFDITLRGFGVALSRPGLLDSFSTWNGLDASEGSVNLTREAGYNRTLTTVESVSSHKYMTLTVEKAPGEIPLKRTVEVSSNLLDWYSGRNHTRILQNDASILKVRDNTPTTPENKRYIRLK